MSANWANVFQSFTEFWVPTLGTIAVGIAIIVYINVSKKKKAAER